MLPGTTERTKARPDVADPAGLLTVSGLCVQFGGLKILDEVSFRVDRGSITGLIGPNGAGKTTVLNCLSRFYQPQSGDIRYADRSLIAERPHEIAQFRMGRTFQNLALFLSMSVRDNVLVGGHSRSAAGYFADGLRLPFASTKEKAINARADEILDYLGLTGIRDTTVSELPFGIQKQVELARALALNPELLLLDEPACGLNHEEVGAFGETIQKLQADFQITILMVEHHMGLVMSLCDHVVVLNFGKVLAVGTPEFVRNDPAVVKAYLGNPKQ